MFKVKHTDAAAALAAAHDGDTAAATAARRDYVTEVTQLVDEQSEVLFRMLCAAAAQHITVTRTARSLTASMGAHAAVFRIEAITDRPADMGRARAFATSQARCLLPTSDGTTAEWILVLQSLGTGAGVPRHNWMDAQAAQPLTEAMMATILRSVFP